MKVWRLAHKSATYNGFPTGPYCTTDTIPDVDTVEILLAGMYAAHIDDDHPTPYADPDLGHMRSHERCGFDSREALDIWFENFHGPLHACGFIVYVYEVDDEFVRVGNHGQALFDPINSTLISTEQLNVTPVQLALF